MENCPTYADMWSVFCILMFYLVLFVAFALALIGSIRVLLKALAWLGLDEESECLTDSV